MLAPTATEVTTAATVFNNTAAEDLVTTITGSTRSFKSDTGSGTAATDCNNEMVTAFSPATAYAIVALSIAIAIVFATASGGPSTATRAKSSNHSQLAWPQRLLRGHPPSVRQCRAAQSVGGAVPFSIVMTC